PDRRAERGGAGARSSRTVAEALAQAGSGGGHPCGGAAPARGRRAGRPRGRGRRGALARRPPPAGDRAGVSLRAAPAPARRAHGLHGVSFTVARGEIVALLGRNGMGKTTTLRNVAGLNTPWRGSAIFLAEKSIASEPPERIAELGASYVPDDRRIFADLTAAENLRVAELALRRVKSRWTRARIESVFPPLAKLWDRKGRHLSGGEQKMLA